MKMIKRITAIISIMVLIITCFVVPVAAKTSSAEKADNIFFYAENSAGKSVLLKVMSLDELKEISHGQANGENYFASSIDNYPTTQYAEAKGFSINELVDFIKSESSVKGVDKINFKGKDAVKFMATDSFGNYSRIWTWEELYGESRYFFEDLFDITSGWKSGWEIAGGDNSQSGISLSEYNQKYKNFDKYYKDKRAVFSTGKRTEPILATESLSGRTTTDTLVASTELGISSYIKANGGKIAGCLKDVLTDDYSLRLILPMTEGDLMSAHRTSYDNFKWIYNIKLDMETDPNIVSAGTVAEPIPKFTQNGNKLTITFDCVTQGASIYYGFEGAGQNLYTGPIQYDITGRNLESDPVTIYVTAVKEGYDDAGLLTYKYPGMAPSFKTIYSSLTSKDLIFEASDTISAGEWNAWTGNINFISMKTPYGKGYTNLKKDDFIVDNTKKTITLKGSLFKETGSYSFIFHATKYANKNASVTIKRAAPMVNTVESYRRGGDITLNFDDANYQKGLTIYVLGEDGNRSMISSNYLDRTQEGKVIIKSEYFGNVNCMLKDSGSYTLELSNSGYSPNSQKVKIILTEGGFTDVLPGSWYYTYVTELAEAGIINGMTPTTFNPDGTLTWGQALKLIMMSTGYEEQAKTGTHWASGYMDAAKEAGLITGSQDPDAEITRLEFCQVTAKVLKAETSLTKTPFTDTADESVLALYEKGIINGMTTTTFVPKGTLSRAQISKIIWCITNTEGAIA